MVTRKEMTRKVKRMTVKERREKKKRMVKEKEMIDGKWSLLPNFV